MYDINEKKIVKAMAAKGLSQVKFAKAMKCGLTTIRNFIKGKRAPSFKFLFRACEILEVEPRDLLE